MTELFNRKEFKQRRRRLRRDMPKGEQILWNHLRSNQLGFKFRRQFSIDNMTVDFYCPKVRLVVEVDGITHQDDDVRSQDRRRDEFCRQLGLTVLRYTSEDIFGDIDKVKVEIYTTCSRLIKERQEKYD